MKKMLILLLILTSPVFAREGFILLTNEQAATLKGQIDTFAGEPHTYLVPHPTDNTKSWVRIGDYQDKSKKWLKVYEQVQVISPVVAGKIETNSAMLSKRFPPRVPTLSV